MPPPAGRDCWLDPEARTRAGSTRSAWRGRPATASAPGRTTQPDRHRPPPSPVLHLFLPQIHASEYSSRSANSSCIWGIAKQAKPGGVFPTAPAQIPHGAQCRRGTRPHLERAGLKPASRDPEPKAAEDSGHRKSLGTSPRAPAAIAPAFGRKGDSDLTCP